MNVHVRTLLDGRRIFNHRIHPAALVGLTELGATEITVVARNPDKAARLLDLGRWENPPAQA